MANLTMCNFADLGIRLRNLKRTPVWHEAFLQTLLIRLFKLVFVYVYTFIRARAVQNSLDNTFNAKEFLFLSWRDYFFMRNLIYAYL